MPEGQFEHPEGWVVVGCGSDFGLAEVAAAAEVAAVVEFAAAARCVAAAPELVALGAPWLVALD